MDNFITYISMLHGINTITRLCNERFTTKYIKKDIIINYFHDGYIVLNLRQLDSKVSR